MKTLLLALFLPVSASAALVNVQSPALEQLKDADGSAQQAAESGRPEKAAAQGGVGFSVRTLQPSGYVGDDGSVKQDPAPAPTTPATPGSGSYIFEGHSPIKGITVYTPKDDPTGKGSTSKGDGPALPFSKKLTYGALGGGGALAAAGVIGLALGGPVGLFAALLGIGALLLGAGAVMFLVNRKASGA